MKDKAAIHSFVLEFASSQGLRHEVHEFPAGAMMIDIWKGPKLYVVQIEQERVGFSIVTDDEPGFSTLADAYYPDFQSFKVVFEEALNK